MIQKVCSKCKESKDILEFVKRTGTNKPISRCKKCEKTRSIEYLNKIKGTPYGGFLHHKNNANSRGIPFKLSYEEWLDIWEKSGKLHLRGRGKGKYCMCRIGDLGGYELGNVFIDLCTYNTREGNIGKILSDETKLKIAAYHTKKPKPWVAGKNNPMHRQDVKDKMSLAIGGKNHYNQRGINTPNGYFPTAKIAALAMNINKSTVEWRAKHNKFGYSYHKPSKRSNHV